MKNMLYSFSLLPTYHEKGAPEIANDTSYCYSQFTARSVGKDNLPPLRGKAVKIVFCK